MFDLTRTEGLQFSRISTRYNRHTGKHMNNSKPTDHLGKTFILIHIFDDVVFIYSMLTLFQCFCSFMDPFLCVIFIHMYTFYLEKFNLFYMYR